MLPWDLIKLLKMSLHYYGVKEFAGSFIKEPSCEKCPDLSVAPFFCPQQWEVINLARKWIPRNCVQKWARATKTFRPKKIQCNVNVAMVGTVKRHCQSLVVSIWYLMWDQEEEVSDCQIVKYKYLTSTNRWQPFDDHWGTSVASELNLWDNFQQPMGGRSLYSLMVGRNFDGPPI